MKNLAQWIFLALFASSSCVSEESSRPSTPASPAAHATAEVATSADEFESYEDEGPRRFGAALSARSLTPLVQIASAPETFAGQVVKTEGEITQVCQRMGCWMEMRAEGAPAIRVPMAGHDFFLPRDVAGQHVVIEGEVAVVELSDEQRAHLESEGAQAVASTLQISATGVELGES